MWIKMLFNSTFFLLVFLPIALIGWYLLQNLKTPVPARIFLVGMSLWFYGYYNPSYLLVLVGSLFVNYLCSALLKAEKPGRRFFTALGGQLFNVGLLFYFKYFNFFLDNCNFFFHTNWQVERIALPLGISFFTFQQISFLVERYRDRAPHYRFIDYACFITFFPQLIAGPIVLHSEFLPQLLSEKNRKPDANRFFDGMALFILGLAKKVLLADTLAIVVNAEYGNIAYLDLPSAWVVIICYMLELYFDFSGYCDMARGIGKLFGFELPENFHAPLKADSVRDFWHRWHITLSRFLTQYIYIPLGGNRKGKARKCLNLLIVFAVSGLWHGANWTFVVWGLLHGIAMVWETLFPKLRFRWNWCNRLVTGVYVTLTFSVFRSDSLTSAWVLIKKLFAGGFHGFFAGMCNTLQIQETYLIRKALELKSPAALNPFYMLCMAALLIIAALLIKGKMTEEWIAQKGQTKGGILVLATLFTWAFVSLSQVSTFLYFNF